MITLAKEAPGDVLVAARLPRVNLLPPEIAEREHLQRVQLGLAGTVLAAAGVVGLLYLSAAGAVGDAEAQVQAAAAEQSQLQARTAAFREVTTVQAQTASAEASLVQAMGEEVRYSRFLDDLATTLPKRVWVTSVSFSQGAAASAGSGATGIDGIGTATIAGVAESHGDLAVWLETLAKQKGYTRPYLDNATKTLLQGQKVVNFSTTVAMTSEALSGRYSQVGSPR